MKAASLVGPRRFEFIDIPTPEAGDGQVLIRSEYASVCGSDLRYYDHTYPEEEYPLRPGHPCHEIAGVIEESHDSRFHRGQRVIALRNANMTEYSAVNGDDLVLLPDSGLENPALWVLCQPIGTVMYSLQMAGSMLGQRVLITGQGPIGLAFTQFVARAGASQVIVTDKHDYRLEKARQMGATHTINVTRQDPLEAITAMTGGNLADVAIEAAGRRETVSLLFRALKLMGLAVIFGMAHDDPIFPIDWGDLNLRIPRILFTNSSYSGDRSRAVGWAVDLVSQGRFDVRPWLTHEIPWSEVGRAFETYSNKTDNSLKVVMSVK
jgi:threonine dehydrogenase-like Zn-dependent dehydrogenase